VKSCLILLFFVVLCGSDMSVLLSLVGLCCVVLALSFCLRSCLLVCHCLFLTAPRAFLVFSPVVPCDTSIVYHMLFILYSCFYQIVFILYSLMAKNKSNIVDFVVLYYLH
jgi:hypothetical protein